MAIITYSSESDLRHPRRLARAMFRDLHDCHRLAARLALRDLRTQYRQSILGVLWAVLLPMSNTASWLFVQHTGIVEITGAGASYGIFVLTGAMMWSIFTDAVNAPLQQTLSAKSLLVKIKFPREALVVAGLYQTLFHAIIKVVLVIGLLTIGGYHLGLGIFTLPIAIGALMLAGTTLGLLLTPIGVLYGDVGRGLPVLTQFLIFVTPVAYPVPVSGWAAHVMRNNPLTPLVEFARDSLLSTDITSLPRFACVNAMMFVVLLVVWLVYRTAMPILIERMGNQS